MIYGRSGALGRAALGRARRGPLPAGRLPGAGVGGGDHPPARPRSAWSASRPPCRTPTSWPTGSRTVRGPTATVIEDQRPVELANLYMVGDQDAEATAARPDPGRRSPNPEATASTSSRRDRCGRGRPRRRWFTPRRLEVVDGCATEELLPAHLLHLQPGRLRRRGRRLPGCRSAAHRRRRARAHPGRSSSSTSPGSPTTTWPCSATTGSWPVSRPASPRTTPGMVPPFKEAVEACFAAGPGEGRVRHRDPGAGHQHAGPHGRDREAHEVHRRAPRVPDARAVHAAHRSRRAPRHRPDGHGRRPVVAVRARSTRSPAWPPSRTFRLTSAFRPTYNMAANLVRRYPADRGPPPAEPLVRAVPGRPGGGAPRGAAGSAAGGAGRRHRRRPPASSATSTSTGPCAVPSGDGDAPPGAPGSTVEAAGAAAAGRRDRAAGAQPARRPWPCSRWPGARAGVRVKVVTSQARTLDLGRADFDESPAIVGRHRPPGAVRAQRPALPAGAWPASCATCATAAGRTSRPATPTAWRADLRPWRGAGVRPTRSTDAPTATQHLRAARQAERIAREIADLQRVRCRAAPSRWPGGSTGCCACSRHGATSTAGRSPAGAAAACASTTSATCWWPSAARAGPARRPRPGRRWPGSCRASPTSTAAPTPPPPPWFPSGRRPPPRASGSSSWPRSSTPTSTAAGLPLTRPPDPGFFAAGPRLGGGRAARPGARRRGAVGRRLRPQRQAAHRPAPPGRPTRHRPRRRSSRPRRPPTALFRGVVAASSAVGSPGAHLPDRRSTRDRSSGGRHGARPGRCPPARRGRALRRARPGPSSSAARRAGEPGAGARACSAATCAARSAAPATRPGCGPSEAITFAGRPRRGARRRPAALVRRPPGRPHGSWWRGRIVAAMNAEWLGEWDLGPRAHPERRPARHHRRRRCRLGDRLKARRRARTGTHVPHPGIEARQVAALQWDLDPGSTCGSTASGSPSGRQHLSVASSPTPHRRRSDRAARGRAGAARLRCRDGSSRPPRPRVVDEVDRRADVLLRRLPRDPRAPRAGLRGALRPRPAHRHPRGRGPGRRARRLRPRHRLRGPGRAREGPVVAVLCEYDALPEIGHACGHNIIAAAGLGAGLAAAAVADELGGRVRVLGTPAEEGGGGKVFMIDRGALDGVDAGDDGAPGRRATCRAWTPSPSSSSGSTTRARPPTPRPFPYWAATRSTPPCSAT